MGNSRKDRQMEALVEPAIEVKEVKRTQSLKVSAGAEKE